MTSFEYQPNMPSNDFVLYSPDEYANMLAVTSQSYASVTTASPYLDPTFGGVSMASLDSFGSMPAYAAEMAKHQQQQNEFALGFDEPRAQYGYSPNMSPANSTDLMPPQLSTASESGASVSSSNMGSPSLNPNFVGESWATGLGLAPSIVQPESFGQDAFAAAALEQDVMISADKHQGCVGESQTPLSAASQPFSSSRFSSSFVSPLRSSHVGRPQGRTSDAPSPRQLGVTASSPIPAAHPERRSSAISVTGSHAGTFKVPASPANARFAVPLARTSSSPQLNDGAKSAAFFATSPELRRRRPSLLSNQIWPPPTPPSDHHITMPSPSRSTSSPMPSVAGPSAQPLDSSCVFSLRHLSSFSPQFPFLLSLASPSTLSCLFYLSSLSLSLISPLPLSKQEPSSLAPVTNIGSFFQQIPS